MRVKFLAAFVAAAVMGIGASAASARTTTLHFFSKAVYSQASDASGNPLSPNTQPPVGSRFDNGDDDYVGTFRHHARRATASDHVVCILQSDGNGLCDGAIAVNGSLIIADDFKISFADNAPTTTVIKITGGTGRYRHARGTIIAKSVGKNGDDSDLTVRVTS